MCTRKENLEKLFELFSRDKSPLGGCNDLEELYYYISNCWTDNEIKESINFFNTCRDTKEWYVAMSSRGLFEKPPVLIEKSLAYSPTKYLHWFRGYYFQISNTLEGVGSIAHSCTNLHYLEDNFNDKHIEYNNFMFATCALITALYFYDTTMNLLSTKDGVGTFNEFLQVSAENEYLVRNDVCLDDCLKRVTKEESIYKPNFDIYDGVTISIVCNNGKGNSKATFGVLNICENAVRFMYQTKDKKYVIHTITAPECAPRQSEFYLMLVEFIIAYTGFRVVWYDIYPLNKLSKNITPISYNCKNSVSALREISSFITELLDNK